MSVIDNSAFYWQIHLDLLCQCLKFKQVSDQNCRFDSTFILVHGCMQMSLCEPSTAIIPMQLKGRVAFGRGLPPAVMPSILRLLPLALYCVGQRARYPSKHMILPDSATVWERILRCVLSGDPGIQTMRSGQSMAWNNDIPVAETEWKERKLIIGPPINESRLDISMNTMQAGIWDNGIAAQIKVGSNWKQGWACTHNNGLLTVNSCIVRGKQLWLHSRDLVGIEANLSEASMFEDQKLRIRWACNLWGLYVRGEHCPVYLPEAAYYDHIASKYTS